MASASIDRSGIGIIIFTHVGIIAYHLFSISIGASFVFHVPIGYNMGLTCMYLSSFFIKGIPQVFHFFSANLELKLISVFFSLNADILRLSSPQVLRRDISLTCIALTRDEIGCHPFQTMRRIETQSSTASGEAIFSVVD